MKSSDLASVPCLDRGSAEPAAGERFGEARYSALRKVRGLCFKMLGNIAQVQGDKAAALRRQGDAIALDLRAEARRRITRYNPTQFSLQGTGSEPV